MHAVGAAEPTEDVEFRGHAVHNDIPLLEEKVFTGQLVHTVAPWSEYCPAGQMISLVALGQ